MPTCPDGAPRLPACPIVLQEWVRVYSQRLHPGEGVNAHQTPGPVSLFRERAPTHDEAPDRPAHRRAR
eukprot:1839889-Prymnesium_polylepis.1